MTLATADCCVVVVVLQPIPNHLLQSTRVITDIGLHVFELVPIFVPKGNPLVPLNQGHRLGKEQDAVCELPASSRATKATAQMEAIDEEAADAGRSGEASFARSKVSLPEGSEASFSKVEDSEASSFSLRSNRTGSSRRRSTNARAIALDGAVAALSQS